VYLATLGFFTGKSSSFLCSLPWDWVEFLWPRVSDSHCVNSGHNRYSFVVKFWSTRRDLAPLYTLLPSSTPFSFPSVFVCMLGKIAFILLGARLGFCSAFVSLSAHVSLCGIHIVAAPAVAAADTPTPSSPPLQAKENCYTPPHFL